MNATKTLLFVLVLLSNFVCIISAQTINPDPNEVFVLNSTNGSVVKKYLKHWKSNSNIEGAEKAYANKEFKSFNDDGRLNLAKLKTNLWIHLFVDNKSKKDNIYWWGFYTQSDLIQVYEKIENKWRLIETLDYSKNFEHRKSKTRFLATQLDFNKNPKKELLIQLKNRRHTTNLYSDITTPTDNLKWEINFYWEIAFFVGFFFLTFIVSLLLGFTTKIKVFYLYAFYIFIVICITLHEELFISVFTEYIFNFLIHLNSQPLALIGTSLHFFITIYIIKSKSSQIKFEKYMLKFLNFNIALGLILCLLYAVFLNQIGFDLLIYSLIWNFITVLICLTILFNFLIIVLYFYNKKQIIVGLILSFLFLFFNSATYYLNYSGILKIYDITHPNYFFLISILEILALGFLIGFSIKKTIDNNFLLLKEKKQFETEIANNKIQFQKSINTSILNTQEQILQSISREIHDDAGQQLTVINFQLEKIKLNQSNLSIDQISQISQISKSVNFLSETLRNLSHSLNSSVNSSKPLNQIISNEVKRLSKINTINITFNQFGRNEIHVDDNEKIIIYRIFQELINNALKHANATDICIEIYNENQFTLVVKDNGIGFESNKKYKQSNGLKNIYERAKLISYQLEFDSDSAFNTIAILKKEKTY